MLLLIFACFLRIFLGFVNARPFHTRFSSVASTSQSLSRNTTSHLFNERDKRDNTKYVFMHHIVGSRYVSDSVALNYGSFEGVARYDYTLDDWKGDIHQIESGGVDAIALNFGSDSWQKDQLKNAYTAASGSGIKLFLSFDFTVFPCDVNAVVDVVNQFSGQPGQFMVNGKPMVSSYFGDCLGNSGWQHIKDRTNGYLMPFIPGLEGQFNHWQSLDSWFCWGCAWPQGGGDKTTADDEYYLNQLGSRYATTVSPWMFTHYDYKNWYQRGDNWLLPNRWEQIVGLRDRISMVEMVTWNDFGESDYFGDINGMQPQGTTWADGYSHLPFFEMSKYYITAFKTGAYPAITEDAIYYWARPHPAGANALADHISKPSGYEHAEDKLWAVVFATQSGQVTLQCGSSSESFTVQAGVTKLAISLSPGQITVSMSRNGRTLINQTPDDFSYNPNPRLYNYNAYIRRANAGPGIPVSTDIPTSTRFTLAPSPTINILDSSWDYQGCYQDYSPRILPDLFTQDSAQALDKCFESCKAAGYKVAGVEFGVECYCANNLDKHAVKASEGDCNMPCAGAANEKCGGGNRINVYSIRDLGSTAPPQITPTPTPAPIPSSPSSTPTSTSISSAPTPSGSAFSFYGCVAEGTTGSRRALTGASFSRPDMTAQMCQSLCAGYAFAGVEYGQECYCGNTLTNNGATGLTTSPSRCSTPCAGDSSTTCGDAWTLNVYATPDAPKPQHSFNWKSLGCYTDSSSRFLHDYSISQSGMTTAVCISICSNQGFAYAATEFGTECYCGSQVEPSDGAGSPTDDGKCDAPCDGNTAETCGGAWHASVHVDPDHT